MEVTSKFRCGFNRHQSLLENLPVTPRFAFFACQCFTGHSRGKLLVRSGSEVSFVFTFYFWNMYQISCCVLAPTLVSLVSSACSLSALFSSSRFLASLVSFGYLAFCLLFVPSLFFCGVLFCLFITSLRSWNWLISAIVCYLPICVLPYECFSFACFFLVLLFFKGGFALTQLRAERAAAWTSLFC